MNYILNLILVLSLVSCGASQPEKSSTQKQTDTLKGSYQVMAIGDNAEVSKDVNIQFDSKTHTVSGYSGCNNFSAQYEADGNTLTLTGVIATLRACDGEVDRMERLFFKSLNSVTDFQIEDGQLQLLSNDKIVMRAMSINKQLGLTEDLETKQDKSDGKMQHPLSLVYQTQTRGAFRHIKLQDHKLYVANDQYLKDEKAYECSDAEWNEILNLFKDVSVKSLPVLEAPSQDRFHDGAAIATLTVNENGNAVTSAAFDHGNPPKAIAELINRIISMADKFSKTND